MYMYYHRNIRSINGDLVSFGKCHQLHKASAISALSCTHIIAVNHIANKLLKVYSSFVFHWRYPSVTQSYARVKPQIVASQTIKDKNTTNGYAQGKMLQSCNKMH